MKKFLQALIISFSCLSPGWAYAEASAADMGQESAHSTNPLEKLSNSEQLWNEAVESWKKSGNWPKKDLVGLLKSYNLRTRCLAIDILEELAEDDFGFDPWQMPERVHADVHQAWAEWLENGKVAQHKSGSLTEEEKARFIEKQVGIILTIREQNRERANHALESFPDEGIAFITQYIKSHPELQPKALGELQTTRCRLLLSKSSVENRGRLAIALCQGARDQIIQGLEDIRACKSAELLPVVEPFLSSSDALIRETATDVFISVGKDNAVKHIMPWLLKETDPNVLQIAFRRSIDHVTTDMVGLYKKNALNPNEDLALAALESLTEIDSYQLRSLVEAVTPRAGTLLGRIFSPATAAPKNPASQFFLSTEDLTRLLSHQNWRIRLAAMNYIQRHGENNLAAIRQQIVAMLDDEDASVREAALNVCLNAKFEESLPAIQKLALQDAEQLPFVVYAITYFDRPLDDSLKVALRRASAEQVAELFRYDSVYDSVFNTSKPTKNSKAVFDLLLTSSNKDVRNMALATGFENITSNLENWEKLLPMLKQDDLPLEVKKHVISKFPTDIYDKTTRQFIKRALPGAEVDLSQYNYMEDDEKKPIIPNLEKITGYEKEFLSLLREYSRKNKDPQFKAIARESSLLLIRMGDPETLVFLNEGLEDYDDEFLDRLLYNIPVSKHANNAIGLLTKFISLHNRKLEKRYLMGKVSDIIRIFINEEDKKLEGPLLDFMKELLVHSPNAIEHISCLCSEYGHGAPVFGPILRSNIGNEQLPIDLRLCSAITCWHLDKNTLNEKDIESISRINHPLKNFVLHLFKKPDFSSTGYAEWLAVLAESERAEERIVAASLSIRCQSQTFIIDLGGESKFVLSSDNIYSIDPVLKNTTPEFERIVNLLLKDREPAVRALANVALLYDSKAEMAAKGVNDILFMTEYKDDMSPEASFIVKMIKRFYSEYSKKIFCRRTGLCRPAHAGQRKNLLCFGISS